MLNNKRLQKKKERSGRGESGHVPLPATVPYPLSRSLYSSSSSFFSFFFSFHCFFSFLFFFGPLPATAPHSLPLCFFFLFSPFFLSTVSVFPFLFWPISPIFPFFTISYYSSFSWVHRYYSFSSLYRLSLYYINISNYRIRWINESTQLINMLI